ncbi:MAG: type II toxin-antitoxin system VapC family toxin [Candidatus Jordarchaeales archaeon]
MSLLFDASSIFKALVERKVGVLYGNYTLDLAVYEVGNVLWKRVSLLRDVGYEEAIRLTALVKRVFKLLKKVDVSCHEQEVIDIAVKLGITFYDASYVFAAKSNNFTLVTEDEKLKMKVGSYVSALSLKEVV